MPSGLYYNGNDIRGFIENIKDLTKSLPDGQWRIYFNDEMHWSGMSHKELAKLLSVGNMIDTPFKSQNAGNIPARPALQQWASEDRQAIKDMIARVVKEGFRTQFRDSRGRLVTQQSGIAKEVCCQLLSMFQEFVEAARVQPENSPFTIERKGFDKPWVERGDLINDGVECAYEPLHGRTTHTSLRVSIKDIL